MSALITTSTLLALLHYTIASRCFSTQFLSEVFQYQPEDKLVGDWLSFPYDELLVNKTAIFNIGYKTNGSMHADVHIQPSTNIIRRRLDIIDKSQEVCSDIVRCRDPNILFMYCGTDLIVYKLEMFGLMYKKPYKVSLIGQICRVFLSNPGFEASIDFFCKRGHDVFLFSAQYEPSNHTMNIVNRGELTAYSKEGSDLYDQLSLQYYNETSTKSTILIGYKRPNTSKPIDYESSSFLYVYRFDPSDWSQNTRLSIMKLGSLYFSLSPPDPLDDTLKLIHLHVDRQVFVAYICNTHNRCHTCTCGIEVMVNKVACDRGRDQTTDGQLPVAFNASRSVVFDVHGIVTYATDAGVAKIYAIVDGVDLVRSNIIGVPRYMEWIDTGHRLPFRVSGVIRAFQVTAEIMVILGERVKEVNGVNKTFKVLITIKEGVLGVYDTSNLLKQHKIDCHISAIGSLTYNQYLGKTFFYQTCNSELHLMALARKKYIFKIGQTTNDFTDVEFTFECIDSDRKSIEVFKRNILVLRHPNIIQYASLPDIQRSIRTKHIQFPTYKSMVRGNGISFEMISPSERAIMYQYHSSIMQESILQVKFTTFTRLMELGDNYIAMFNDTYLQLVQCVPAYLSTNIMCESEFMLGIELKDTRVLDVVLMNNLFTIALDIKKNTTSVTNNDRFLALRVYNITGTLQHETSFDYIPKSVDFLINSNYVIMNVIAQEHSSASTGLYYTQFNPLKDKHLPVSLLVHFMFPSSLCPQRIAVDYRSRFTVLINCRCQNSSRTTVVNFNLNVDNIAGSQTDVPMFFDAPVSLLCSTAKSLFVFQPGSVKLFIVTFNMNYARFSRIRMPIDEYNVTEVLDIFCETRKKVLQVLGRTKSGTKKLITFRTEGFDDATRRVHSMVDVSADGAKLLKINDISNDFLTVIVMNSKMLPVEAYRVEMNGPLLFVNSSNQIESEAVTLTIKAELAGLQPMALNAEQQIIFLSTDQYFQAKPKDPQNKFKVIDDLNLDLDAILNVYGIYSSVFVNNSHGFSVTDRIPVVNTFKGLNNIDLWRSCSINDLVMGYKVDEEANIKVMLINGTSGKILSNFSADHVIALECIQNQATGEAQFYSLVLNHTGFNWVNVFYSAPVPTQIIRLPISDSIQSNIIAGDTFIEWRIAGLNMQIDGYNYAEFRAGSSGSVILAAFSLKYGYSSIVRVLSVKQDLLVSSNEVQRETKDVVTHYEIVPVKGDYVVVSSEQNDITLRMQTIKYYNNNNTLLQYGVIFIEFKDFIQGLISSKAFGCKVKNITLLQNVNVTIQCAMFDDDSTGLLFEIYLNSSDHTLKPFQGYPLFDLVGSMESIPYTVPVNVETYGDYIFVYSRTDQYRKTSRDLMITVIYRRPSSKYKINPKIEFIPYKVISSKTLNVGSSYSLLDGNYYIAEDGTDRFYLGGGTDIQLLFNLTGLTLKIHDINAINKDSSIGFQYPKQSNGICNKSDRTENFTLYLHEMIDLNDSSSGTPHKISKKRLLLLISASALVLLLSLLVYLVSCSENRSKIRFADLINDQLQDTINHIDSPMGTGAANYD